MSDAERRLADLGLRLPEAPQPVANYVPHIVSGDQLFISGQIAKDHTGRVLTGLLGADVSVEALEQHKALLPPTVFWPRRRPRSAAWTVSRRCCV